MTYWRFANHLKAMGASIEDVRRLDREGRQSALDAHGDMLELGEFETWNDLHSFCAHIGREFVLDNIDDLFFIRKEDA